MVGWSKQDKLVSSHTQLRRSGGQNTVLDTSSRLTGINLQSEGASVVFDPISKDYSHLSKYSIQPYY